METKKDIQELIDFLNKYNQTFIVKGNQIIADNIYLSHNQLTSLPESISNIKCNNISLSHNQLTSFPESISNIKCNYIELSHNQLTSLPEVNKFNSIEITDEYIYCDGILVWYDKKKVIREYTLFMNHYVCVATKDFKVFAHGENSISAISDLEFKILSETFKNKPLKLKDKIGAFEYIAITGACDSGIRDWMDKHQMKYMVKNKRTIEREKMSVKDLLPLLEKDGAYGLNKFKQLIK